MRKLFKWIKSWTINYATALTLVGIVQTNLEMLQLTPKQMGFGMIILGAITTLLRVKTEKQASLDER